jgi:hypothetical protein
MKKTINKYFALLFLFLLSASLASSQMKEPEQVELKYNGVTPSKFRSTDSNFITDRKILIGFHWGNEKSIASAVLSNQNNIFPQQLFSGTTPNASMVQDNALLFIQDVDSLWNYRTFSHVLADKAILHTHSMTWEPNMLVCSTDKQRDIIAKRPNDPAHPIFGFFQRTGTVDSSGANVSFLIIPDSTYKDQTIFSDPTFLLFLHSKFIIYHLTVHLCVDNINTRGKTGQIQFQVTGG